MNQFFLTLLSVVFYISTCAKIPCHVEGLVESSYSGYLTLGLDAPKQLDKFETTIPVVKGKICADIWLPVFGVYYAMKDSDYRTTRYMVIDTANIYLNEKSGSPYIYCQGSTTMSDFSHILDMRDSERGSASVYIRAKMMHPDDSLAIRAAEAAMQKAMKHRRDGQTKFINKYPNSFASAYELTNYNFEYELDTIRKLYAGLGPSARYSIYGRRILEKINNVKLLGIGRRAPDIGAKDAAGKFIHLSDFRGKYVLLDFWASWCAPCRIQVPFIKKVNKEFGDKVQVLSVSIDSKKGDWIEAVKKDSMTWINVRDEGAFQSKSAKAYKLESIPTIYLISPDGSILTSTLNDKAIYNSVKNEVGKAHVPTNKDK